MRRFIFFVLLQVVAPAPIRQDVTTDRKVEDYAKDLVNEIVKKFPNYEKAAESFKRYYFAWAEAKHPEPIGNSHQTTSSTKDVWNYMRENGKTFREQQPQMSTLTPESDIVQYPVNNLFRKIPQWNVKDGMKPEEQQMSSLSTESDIAQNSTNHLFRKVHRWMIKGERKPGQRQMSTLTPESGIVKNPANNFFRKVPQWMITGGRKSGEPQMLILTPESDIVKNPANNTFRKVPQWKVRGGMKPEEQQMSSLTPESDTAQNSTNHLFRKVPRWMIKGGRKPGEPQMSTLTPNNDIVKNLANNVLRKVPQWIIKGGRKPGKPQMPTLTAKSDIVENSTNHLFRKVPRWMMEGGRKPGEQFIVKGGRKSEEPQMSPLTQGSGIVQNPANNASRKVPKWMIKGDGKPRGLQTSTFRRESDTGETTANILEKTHVTSLILLNTIQNVSIRTENASLSDRTDVIENGSNQESEMKVMQVLNSGENHTSTEKLSYKDDSSSNSSPGLNEITTLQFFGVIFGVPIIGGAFIIPYICYQKYRKYEQVADSEHELT